jgi:hypothetical protein
LGAAKQGYQEVFGLSLTCEDGGSAAFTFGNTVINLLKTLAARELIDPAVVATPDAGSRQQLTIEVEDLDAMYENLVARESRC